MCWVSGVRSTKESLRNPFLPRLRLRGQEEATTKKPFFNMLSAGDCDVTVQCGLGETEYQSRIVTGAAGRAIVKVYVELDIWDPYLPQDGLD
mmetsp:Transcript_20109/g.34635  ORF Transcript_20109/g.34635 Transcript_20109/m.34635 type:complete len:92 (-) Transcript_20109:743-1018(-)